VSIDTARSSAWSVRRATGRSGHDLGCREKVSHLCGAGKQRPYYVTDGAGVAFVLGGFETSHTVIMPAWGRCSAKTALQRVSRSCQRNGSRASTGAFGPTAEGANQLLATVVDPQRCDRGWNSWARGCMVKHLHQNAPRGVIATNAAGPQIPRGRGRPASRHRHLRQDQRSPWGQMTTLTNKHQYPWRPAGRLGHRPSFDGLFPRRGHVIPVTPIRASHTALRRS